MLSFCMMTGGTSKVPGSKQYFKSCDRGFWLTLCTEASRVTSATLPFQSWVIWQSVSRHYCCQPDFVKQFNAVGLNWVCLISSPPAASWLPPILPISSPPLVSYIFTLFPFCLTPSWWPSLHFCVVTTLCTVQVNTRSPFYLAILTTLLWYMSKQLQYIWQNFRSGH